MIVKLVDAAGVDTGKALTLCDDSGEMIGDQISAAVETAVAERSTVTVKFIIDGKKIRWG